MHEDAPVVRSKGTVAVLALLLSVLFSAIDVPANRGGAGSRPSAVGQNDAGKSGALLRNAGRSQGEERDRADPPLPPGGAAVETITLAQREAGGIHAPRLAPPTSFTGHPYRARAPPAAA